MQSWKLCDQQKIDRPDFEPTPIREHSAAESRRYGSLIHLVSGQRHAHFNTRWAISLSTSAQSRE